MITLKYGRKHLDKRLPEYLEQLIEKQKARLLSIDPIGLTQQVVVNFSPNSYKKTCEIWQGTIYIYLAEIEDEVGLDLMLIMQNLLSMFALRFLALSDPLSVSKTIFDRSNQSLIIQPGWDPAKRRLYVEEYVNTELQNLQAGDLGWEQAFEAAGELDQLYQDVRKEYYHASTRSKRTGETSTNFPGYSGQSSSTTEISSSRRGGSRTRGID